MKRYAIVKNARDRAELEAYLPQNYTIIFEFQTADGFIYGPNDKPIAPLKTRTCFVIEGEDDRGWTLDGYVTGRLASGLIWVDEINATHPIFTQIADQNILNVKTEG